MATDLTAVSLRSVNGESVVQIAESTLRSGESMRAAWDQLEPLVRTLTKKVSDEIERDDFEPGEAAKLLSLCASVVHKVGAAAQGMFKASEGMAKLSLLLSAGSVKRRNPQEMTEKQLAAVVLETAKKIVDRTGRCPLCQPVEASAKIHDECAFCGEPLQPGERHPQCVPPEPAAP